MKQEGCKMFGIKHNKEQNKTEQNVIEHAKPEHRIIKRITEERAIEVII